MHYTISTVGVVCPREEVFHEGVNAWRFFEAKMPPGWWAPIRYGDKWVSADFLVENMKNFFLLISIKH